jgi:hypothetical protein
MWICREFLSDEDRHLATVTLPLVSQELASMALYALNFGDRTVADLWKRYPNLYADRIAHRATWFIGRMQAA